MLAAHCRSEQLRDRLQQVALNDDRLRIALKLQHEVVNRIFAATLTLRTAPNSDAGEQTHAQVDKAVDELDETANCYAAAFSTSTAPTTRPDTRSRWKPTRIRARAVRLFGDVRAVGPYEIATG